MGILSAIWALDDDTVLYTFTPAGHRAPAEMSLSRDFARRESVLALPSTDGVLDGFGKNPGPMERRDQAFSFRVFTNGDNDAAYDALAAVVAPGGPVRLVYVTDAGGKWLTTAANPRIQHTLTAVNNWGNGGYIDLTVTWRIRPDWRAQYSETAELFHASTTFAPATTFAGVGVTTIAANPQAFTVDARGVAGFDLPTLPDTGPTITLTGPCGGDSGIRVMSFSATAYDANGAKQPMYFDVPFKLPTANDVAILRFAGQKFGAVVGGVGQSFRPGKPSYQRNWWQVMAGVNNGCVVAPLGANPVVGGKIKVDWTRRRA